MLSPRKSGDDYGEVLEARTAEESSWRWQRHACSNEPVDADITVLADPEGSVLCLQIMRRVPGRVDDHHPACSRQPFSLSLQKVEMISLLALCLSPDSICLVICTTS